MQRNKQIGFIVEDLTSSQLSFNLIKNLNDFLEDSDVDCVVFFENAGSPVVNPNFSIMSINEIWNFDGDLVATSMSTALRLSKTFSPNKKFYYVWDLEWLRRHGKTFEYNVQAFRQNNCQLISRSLEHSKAIENYCNKPVKYIVEDFNIKKIMEIINE
jgi:hypothetical protein